LKKPMPPKIKMTAPKAAPAPKPKAATAKPKAATGVPTWYDENGKPDPKGLYNRDQMMARTSVPKDSFPKQAPKERVRSKEEIEAAKRNGFLR
jgi:hypothetical protein